MSVLLCLPNFFVFLHSCSSPLLTFLAVNHWHRPFKKIQWSPLWRPYTHGPPHTGTDYCYLHVWSLVMFHNFQHLSVKSCLQLGSCLPCSREETIWAPPYCCIHNIVCQIYQKAPSSKLWHVWRFQKWCPYEWVGGWMDGWTDGWTLYHIISCYISPTPLFLSPLIVSS